MGNERWSEQKVEFSDAGSIIAEQFEEICRKIKIHIYHIFRQYSELKYLKKNLCNNEVILSVDFSKNYSNKQHHEIQSAYFGHESFTLYTCAGYIKNDVPLSINHKFYKDTGLNVIPLVIVSNETKHERDNAFTFNNKVIEFLLSFNTDLN